MYCIGIKHIKYNTTSISTKELLAAAYSGLITKNEFLREYKKNTDIHEKETELINEYDNKYYFKYLELQYRELELFYDQNVRRRLMHKFTNPYIKWLRNKFGYTEKLVDEIMIAYDDLGFPEILEPMVKFMPSNTGNGSINSILNNVRIYLKET